MRHQRCSEPHHTVALKSRTSSWTLSTISLHPATRIRREPSYLLSNTPLARPAQRIRLRCFTMEIHPHQKSSKDSLEILSLPSTLRRRYSNSPWDSIANRSGRRLRKVANLMDFGNAFIFCPSWQTEKLCSLFMIVTSRLLNCNFATSKKE